MFLLMVDDFTAPQTTFGALKKVLLSKLNLQVGFAYICLNLLQQIKRISVCVYVYAFVCVCVCTVNISPPEARVGLHQTHCLSASYSSVA